MSLRAVLRDILKHSLPTERLQSYLPFQTIIRHGDNWNHLVNASIYSVETANHFIYEGATLCGRRRQRMTSATGDGKLDCPGCIAIAKGVVTRTLGV